MGALATRQHRGDRGSGAGGGDIHMAVETGKRYRCNTCGAEFIVTRGGDGALKCGDDDLEQI